MQTQSAAPQTTPELKAKIEEIMNATHPTLSREHPAPGNPPINEEPKKQGSTWDPSREIFIFSYKKGHAVIQTHIQAASLSEAVSKSKLVSTRRRYTWIGISPFIRDIDKMLEED